MNILSNVFLVKIDISESQIYIWRSVYDNHIYPVITQAPYNEVLDIISNSCNRYLESMFLDYLYKTSKDFKSDINGFGNFAAKNFITTNEYNNYNWLESYKDAFFDVQVTTSVKSGMLISET